MWQVVKDTKEGIMDANIFADDWPNFTTVVSQEFSPRLSRVWEAPSGRVINHVCDQVALLCNHWQNSEVEKGCSLRLPHLYTEVLNTHTHTRVYVCIYAPQKLETVLHKRESA